MRILLIGDFHGRLKKTLIPELKKSDIIISSGDFGSIEGIRNLFLKYGASFKEKFSKKHLDKIRKEGLKKGEVILKFLNSLNKKVYLINGNAEKNMLNEFNDMVKKYKNLEIINHKVVIIDSFAIFGFGSIGLDKEPKSFIKNEIKKFEIILNRIRNKNLIFVCHEPPFNSELDLITNKSNLNYGKHVGCKTSRAIIDKFKPLLCLCGHIHERQLKIKINSTVLINPGPAFEGRTGVFNTKTLEIKMIQK